MTSFKYGAYHPIRRYQIGYLDVKNPVWTEALSTGTTLTFDVTVPANPADIFRIREATRPDYAAIYVEADNGQIPWGGVVKRRQWDSDANTWSVTVVEWRSWLYNVLVSPKRDLSGDNVYNYTNVDQFAIARDIVNQILFGGIVNGVPPIQMGSELSGIKRTASFRGTAFQTAGAVIDSFAQLSSGFEWDLEIKRAVSDQLPILQFTPYFPQRGGYVPSLVFLVEPGRLDDLVEDSTNKVIRQWAIGEGPNAESLPYALDVAPDVKYGYRLRTDAATKYNGVYDRTTLASYARAERAFRDVDLNVVSFVTSMNAPDVMSYQKGDRGRFRYRDRLYNIDVKSARILEKQVTPEANQVKVTIDLSDLVAPEVDPNGAV